MKKVKQLAVIVSAGILALSLAACNGETSGSGEAKTEETETSDAAADESAAEPDAEDILDPQEMKWGYQEPGSSNNDYQYWYANGDKTLTQFLIFDDDYLTLVDGAARESVDMKTENGHMVDLETQGEAFDFVFTDVFTCYDYVSGQWYMRADYETVTRSLAASTFVCEAGSQWSIDFGEDNTLYYHNDGEEQTGTWWFENANTVCFQMDETSGGYSGWYRISYEDGSWEIASVADTDVFYPES